MISGNKNVSKNNENFNVNNNDFLTTKRENQELPNMVNDVKNLTNSHFDLSLIHILLLKLLYLQNNQRYFNRYWKTNINGNGLPSFDHEEEPVQIISILERVSSIFSHLVFRRKVDEMLTKLDIAFTKSSYFKTPGSSKFGPHRSVQVHWIPTYSATISSVDVRLCEGFDL